jgi:hypothetical protein
VLGGSGPSGDQNVPPPETGGGFAEHVGHVMTFVDAGGQIGGALGNETAGQVGGLVVGLGYEAVEHYEEFVNSAPAQEYMNTEHFI